MKKTRVPVFTAALFTVARTWKQSTCSSTDEWVKKFWHTYTIEYYSAMKRNTFESVLVRWMNLKHVIQSEVKSEREKQPSYINTYIWHLEKWYRSNYLQGRNRDADIKKRLWTAGEGEGGMN